MAIERQVGRRASLRYPPTAAWTTRCQPPDLAGRQSFLHQRRFLGDRFIPFFLKTTGNPFTLRLSKDLLEPVSTKFSQDWHFRNAFPRGRPSGMGSIGLKTSALIAGASLLVVAMVSAPVAITTLTSDQPSSFDDESGAASFTIAPAPTTTATVAPSPTPAPQPMPSATEAPTLHASPMPRPCPLSRLPPAGQLHRRCRGSRPWRWR